MYLPIEKTEVCLRASALSDQIYSLVRPWDSFDQGTVGKQLVRAVDSLEANLVEGDGRRSDPDSIRFFPYARSSGREARWWIRRAAARGILPKEIGMETLVELTECVKMINGLSRYRLANKVKEERASYDDPFIEAA